MSACESLPFGLPPPMDGPARLDRHWRGRLQEREDRQELLAGGSDDPLMEFWKSAVRKYTTCALTNGKDKLIAIWGIAKLVRDGVGVEYGMGLWEQNLEDQLAWRVAQCSLKKRPAHSENFPTWSWASMDGCIEVPDRLSKHNRPHWTVKDHFGQDLKFDLVGVKRAADSQSTMLADAPSPTLSRGMSDTIVEQKARYRELEKASSKTDAQGTKSTTEVFDRKVEPKFHTTSLPIKGHIGQGLLVPAPTTKGWLLKPEGINNEQIEAFPDTIPVQDDVGSFQTMFAVLSAKQYVEASESDEMMFDGKMTEKLKEGQQIGETVLKEEFHVQGMGILLKDAGKGHFHRNGAFAFRHLRKENWERLLEVEPAKFWLD